MHATSTEPTIRSPAKLQVLALAASVGGLHALGEVLAALPADFGAAVVIVQHVDPNHRSMMAELLGRRTGMPVCQVDKPSKLRPGAVWVAPPDYHLVIDAAGMLSLVQTDRIHHLRPAADPLLESLAAAFGARATAVILTGSGVDGAAGVRAIKACGGTVIVQDPGTSEGRGMPQAAINTGCADQVLPLRDIGPTLVTLMAMRNGNE